MARIHYNNQFGLSGGSLTNVGTTLTFAVAPGFATLVAPDVIPLTLEPGTANEEVVLITAYTSGVTTATITRAAESGSGGGSAIAHTSPFPWVQAPTAGDYFRPDPEMWWGDGSDGVVTISVNTTLTRDMSYDSLTINNGIILTTAGFRIWVKNTLTNNGTIDNSGQDASGATAGSTGAPTGTLGGGGPGATGGTGVGTLGTDPAATTHTGQGSGGGAGGSGGAGAGGTAVTSSGTNIKGMHRAFLGFFYGLILINNAGVITTYSFMGGVGGSSGAGNGASNTGGGGGQGGGVIILNARIFINNGTISAHGGNGGAGVGVGNNGGGGGGGGGYIIINASSITNTGTYSTTFGTGGAKTGTGVVGSNGSAGTPTVSNTWAA